MDVAGARVLITGGAGLVGPYLVNLLVEQHVEEVVLLDDLSHGRLQNLSQAQKCGRVTLVREDIRHAAAVHTAMRGVDLVFHQAFPSSSQCVKQPRSAVEVLINGTFNVLEAAVAAGVRKVVAASSALVYGEPQYVPIDETHITNSRTLYGACCIATEQLLHAFQEVHGLPYVALRYFDVYGPRMRGFDTAMELILQWLEQIAAGQRPIIFGEGVQSLDLVYVGDVAQANMLAMESPVSGEVCNVATGRQTTLRDLATALLQVLGRNDLLLTYVADRKVKPMHLWQGDVRKAQELLGFNAQTDLYKGLQAVVNWWTDARSVAGATW